MEPQAKISYDDLIHALKELSAEQLQEIKIEIDKTLWERKPRLSPEEMRELFLNGPTLTKKELKVFAKNRKAFKKLAKERKKKLFY